MAEDQFQTLKGQLNVRINKDTRAVIGGGRVAFMTENYEYISVSEQEFGQLVDTWINARLEQKNAENEPGITSGEYE